jgi:tetratricopeptide (TPR) repeat protein
VDPKSAVLHQRLTAALLNLREFEEAETVAFAAAQLDPNSYVSHFQLGLIYRFRRKWDKAEASLREAIRLQPGNSLAHTNLGYVLEQLGRSEEALVTAREAVRIQPSPSAQAQLSWILKRQGKSAEADEAFEAALQLLPARGGSRAHFCCMYGRFVAAEKYLMDDVRANTIDTLAPMILALVKLKLGDRQGYEAVCRDMLARFGESDVPGSLERAAKSCLWTPEVVGEVADLKRMTDVAVQRSKEDPVLYYFVFARGLAAYRAGDFEEAVTLCRDSRAKNVHAPSKRESAGIAKADRRNDAAPRLAKGSPKYAPLNAYSLVVEAMALHKQDKSADARAALERAAAIARDSFPDAPDDLGTLWEGWVIYDILSREAEALLAESADSQ